MNKTEKTMKEAFEAPEMEIVIIADDVVATSLEFEQEGYGDSLSW